MSIPYYGDFPEDATVYMIFNTFTSDDPSASCTITDFINTDVHIHKDGNTTQRNNAAGITVSVDYDSITGNHLVTIDTSDDTVAGFWVTGSEYQVRIEGTTVDGATINAWIGSFSIERSGGALALLKNSTYGLSAIETLTDEVETILKGSAFRKNVASSNFGFVMLRATDHVTPETGLTVTGTISKDGGAFASLTNSVSEIGSGCYKVNLTQTEMNADVIILIFTATGADKNVIFIYTID